MEARKWSGSWLFPAAIRPPLNVVDIDANHRVVDRRIPPPPVPFDLDGFTSAVGAHDAFGLGFRVVGAANLGLNTKFGPQRAPGWWLLHYKERMYVDGSAHASGHRSMMATLSPAPTGP